jgi:septal ring factor EnvC (AmiA/AmiB activator)
VNPHNFFTFAHYTEGDEKQEMGVFWIWNSRWFYSRIYSSFFNFFTKPLKMKNKKNKRPLSTNQEFALKMSKRSEEAKLNRSPIQIKMDELEVKLKSANQNVTVEHKKLKEAQQQIKYLKDEVKHLKDENLNLKEDIEKLKPDRNR